MDRENQVEKICNDIVRIQKEKRTEYCLRIQKAFEYKGNSDHEDIPSILKDYEDLIMNRYYKDSIVLSREEYENMQFVVELIGTKQKIGACDFNRVVLQRSKQVRKETIEKFMGVRKYIIEQFHKYHEARNSAETHFNLAKRKSDINVSNIDWHRADAIMIILESVAVMFDEVAEQFGFQIKEQL